MQYTVKEGDHLARIAVEHGFADWRTVWFDSANRELREKRKTPNVLHPGDKLVIRDLETKRVSAATGAKHRYHLKKSPLKLALALQDPFGRPIANAECRLTIGENSVALATDGAGKLQHPIEPHATEAVLTILDPQTSLAGVEIRLAIGHLDPVTERSGQAARLRNLAYLLDVADSGATPADEQKAFGHAVEEFQCDHGLTVDGICGPKTQAKLKEAHGC